jgi:hypothetical protein
MPDPTPAVGKIVLRPAIGETSLATGRPQRTDGKRMHWQYDEPPHDQQAWGDSWADPSGTMRIRLSRGWVTEEEDAQPLTLLELWRRWRADRQAVLQGWHEAHRSPLRETGSGSWTRDPDPGDPAVRRLLRFAAPRQDVEVIIAVTLLALVLGCMAALAVHAVAA